MVRPVDRPQGTAALASGALDPARRAEQRSDQAPPGGDGNNDLRCGVAFQNGSLAERVFQALLSGSSIDVQSETTSNRRIAARDLRDAILQASFVDSAPRRGPLLAGLIVSGEEFDLSSERIPFGLRFEDCTFDCDVVLNAAELEFLVIRRCTVNGELKANDLQAKSMTLAGSILHRFTAHGLEVRGNVFLDHGFDSPIIELIGAKVGGTLFLFPQAKSNITIRWATIQDLRDEPIRWGPGSDAANAQYGVGNTGDSPAWQFEDRLEWLRNLEYSASAWQQVEKIYREHGERDNADMVAIARRVFERGRRTQEATSLRRAISSRLSGLADLLSQWFAGYGYRPSRAVRALLVVVALAVAPNLINFGRSTMTASTADGPTFSAAGPMDWEFRSGSSAIADRCGGGTIPCFNAFFYAIDLVVPLVNLGQVDTWHPDAHRGTVWRPFGIELAAVSTGVLLTWWFNSLALLGWLLSSIGIVTITRLGSRSE